MATEASQGGFRGYPFSWMRTDGLRGVGKLGTNAPRRPNEIHVDLSGGQVSALTLDQIRTRLKWVHTQQGHVTRIDCALDDQARTVRVATIREAVSAGQGVTKGGPGAPYCLELDAGGLGPSRAKRCISAVLRVRPYCASMTSVWSRRVESNHRPAVYENHIHKNPSSPNPLLHQGNAKSSATINL